MRKLVETTIAETTAPEGVEFTVKAPGDLPAGWVDPVQYGQVLHNLLLNSIQAMPEGGNVEVELEESGGYLQTTVRDTGTGIAADDLPKVFEPLFSTKAVGTGFGLAVCRRIVEEHRGTIDVESKEGQGTTALSGCRSGTSNKREADMFSRRGARRAPRLSLQANRFGAPFCSLCSLISEPRTYPLILFGLFALAEVGQKPA